MNHDLIYYSAENNVFFLSNQLVTFSPLELKTLKLLYLNYNKKPIKCDEIIHDLYYVSYTRKEEPEYAASVVKVTIHKLRKKLKEYTNDQVQIKSMGWSGYLLHIPNEYAFKIKKNQSPYFLKHFQKVYL